MVTVTVRSLLRCREKTQRQRIEVKEKLCGCDMACEECEERCFYLMQWERTIKLPICCKVAKH